MILNILRWFFGYVSFTVKGGNVEKFINIVVFDGVTLWDILKVKNTLTAKTSVSDYKKLRFFTRQTNSKIKMLKKFGMPFIVKKYKKRLGLIFGMAIFSTVIYILSLYIWNINITGNSIISTEEIVNVMEELGISSGTLKNRLEIPMIRQIAMSKLPNISWISININGSVANISVKEKVTTPELFPNEMPCDIRASMDGQIERIETYKGTCMVKNGDAVYKNQILISGVVEDYFGNNLFVHADGNVLAKTNHIFQEKIELSKLQPVDTGKQFNRYRIKVFGLEIPLGLKKNLSDDAYRFEFYSKNLGIGNIKLPIIIYKESWNEQTCEEFFFTEEEAIELAKQRLEKKTAEELKNIEIINKDVVRISQNNEDYLQLNCWCFEDICSKQELNID